MRKNKRIFEETITHPQDVALQAITVCFDYKDMQKLILPLKTLNKHWQPPEVDWMKLNVDGAIFLEQGKVGMVVSLETTWVGCVWQLHNLKYSMVTLWK